MIGMGMANVSKAERYQKLFTRLMIGGLAVGFTVALLGVFAEATYYAGAKQVSAISGLTVFGLCVVFVAVLVAAPLSLVAASFRKDTAE